MCYIFLIVLSLYVSQDLLDLSTTDELETIRITVENFQDLDNLNVPIYTSIPRLYDETAVGNETENLKTKTTIMAPQELTNDCFSKLNQENDRICVIALPYTHAFSSLVKKVLNTPVGPRKASFHLLVSAMVQKHGKASPFLEIFNKIILRSLDHGLIDRSYAKKFVEACSLDYDDQDYDEIHVETFNLSHKVLFVVIAIQIFAICVFIIEVFFLHKLKKLHRMYLSLL